MFINEQKKRKETKDSTAPSLSNGSNLKAACGHAHNYFFSRIKLLLSNSKSNPSNFVTKYVKKTIFV